MRFLTKLAIPCVHLAFALHVPDVSAGVAGVVPNAATLKVDGRKLELDVTASTDPPQSNTKGTKAAKGGGGKDAATKGGKGTTKKTKATKVGGKKEASTMPSSSPMPSNSPTQSPTPPPTPRPTPPPTSVTKGGKGTTKQSKTAKGGGGESKAAKGGGKDQKGAKRIEGGASTCTKKRTIYSSNGFESPQFHGGTIYGQDGWHVLSISSDSSTANLNIQDDTVKQGQQALEVKTESDTVGADEEESFCALASKGLNVPIGRRSVTVSSDVLFPPAGNFQQGLSLSGDSGFLAQLFQFQGSFFLANHNSSTPARIVPGDDWRHLAMKIDFVDQTVSASVDDIDMGPIHLNLVVHPTMIVDATVGGYEYSNATVRKTYYDNLEVFECGSNLVLPSYERARYSSSDKMHPVPSGHAYGLYK